MDEEAGKTRGRVQRNQNGPIAQFITMQTIFQWAAIVSAIFPFFSFVVYFYSENIFVDHQLMYFSWLSVNGKQITLKKTQYCAQSRAQRAEGIKH